MCQETIQGQPVSAAFDNGSLPLEARSHQIVGDPVVTESGSGGETPNTDSATTCTTIRLRGRLDAEAIGTTQSAISEATFGNLGNAFGLRRAWIGAEGIRLAESTFGVNWYLADHLRLCSTTRTRFRTNPTQARVWPISLAVGWLYFGNDDPRFLSLLTT